MRILDTVKQSVLRVLAVAAALVFLAAACGGTHTAPTEPGAGSDSPALASRDDSGWPHDFTAPLVGGGEIDASDYEGQDLVLWFWAPW